MSYQWAPDFYLSILPLGPLCIHWLKTGIMNVGCYDQHFFFTQWVLWSNSGSHSSRDNTLLIETIPESQTFLNLLKLSGLLKFILSNNEDKNLKLSWKLQDVYKRIIFLQFARLREVGVTRLDCFISNVLNFCQNSIGKWSEGVSKLGCLFGAISHLSVLVPLQEWNNGTWMTEYVHAHES